jgi:hypothetical protein
MTKNKSAFMVLVLLFNFPPAAAAGLQQPIEVELNLRLLSEFNQNLEDTFGVHLVCEVLAQGRPSYLSPAKTFFERIAREVKDARDAIGASESPSASEIRKKYLTFKRHWDSDALTALSGLLQPHEFMNLPERAPRLYDDRMRLAVEKAYAVLGRALELQNDSYILGSQSLGARGEISLLEAAEIFLVGMRAGVGSDGGEAARIRAVASAYRLSDKDDARGQNDFGVFLSFVDAYYQFWSASFH